MGNLDLGKAVTDFMAILQCILITASFEDFQMPFCKTPLVVCFAALWDSPIKSQAKKSHPFPCIPILTIYNNF